MAQENKKLDKVSDAPVAKGNLVSLQENGKEKQVMEINKQMSALEATIAKLNKKINSSNKQINTDVERLSTSEAGLSEKVADTYKQLGIIETSFKELNLQSNKMSSDLKAVNSAIKSFEKSSSKALNEAIQSQTEVNVEFRQQHVDLIARAETLSKKVSTISTKLNKSIKDNSKAITTLEVKIIAELEQLAQSTQQRDDTLDSKIKSADKAIDSQKAKMLLMQSVDAALEKRAASLEAVSAKLIEDSETLKDSTDTLDILTSKLSGDVEALELHTARLQQQNIEQQGQIDTLSDKTGSLTRTLLALASLERKHFKALAASSLLLLLAVIAIFFYAEYQRDTQQAVTVQHNEVINEQVTQLESRVQDEQMASQVFYSEIIELQKNLNQVQQDLQEKTQLIQQDMKAMNDEVESLDGRVQYLAPLYNFGSKNTIHGSQWLVKLNPDKYSIKVATVAKKQELFEIAQRYNHYFTQELAYFIDDKDQYNLIYGGQFDDQAQVTETLNKMPRYINFQPIALISNSDVLKLIKN